ncbi:MAG: LysM peptidoglycan-binding domain-containing protein [Eubacteriales bacterium]|nr:LysM peptidoglycan-binding domain-containing protein [Eubacteriales bacterium]
MEQEVKKNYNYRRLPENIRQIGEITGQRRVYMEDYVLTYIRRVFEDKRENSIVVFIGCDGKEEAAGSLFIYGALEIPMDTDSIHMEEAQWEDIYREASRYFPGGRVLGWGCGVSIWNSQIDHKVRTMQEEQFADTGRILFLADLSEREEKVFLYDEQAFEELTGYFIYYERNPQMQDYMLREQQKENSFESDYADEVTQTIRTVIHAKKSRQERLHYLAYGMAGVLVIMVLLGANLLVQSLARINSLEKTIETLSEYVAEARQDTSSEIVISRALESEKPNATEQAGSATATPEHVASTAGPAKSPVPAGAANSAAVSPSASPASPTASATPLPIGTATNIPAIAPSPTAASATGTSTSAAGKSADGKGTSQAVVAGGVDRIKRSYIVRKGDTLSQIVWKQYHSFRYMDRVLRVNQIEDSDRIYEGQCILLPDP